MNSLYGLIIIFILSFSFSSQAVFELKAKEKSPKTKSDIRRIVRKYKSKSVEKILRNFVKDTRPNRLVGNLGHKNAFNFISNFIKGVDKNHSNNLKIDTFSPNTGRAVGMYRNDFETKVKPNFKPGSAEYMKWKSFTDSAVSVVESKKEVNGRNIIWEKKGYLEPEKTIILGAHYDNIALDKKTFQVKLTGEFLGADNNASGVAALLGLIEVLSEVDLPKTIQIVFFDFHELGFLGHLDFVNKYEERLKSKNFISFINVLMIGHDSKTGDKLKKYGNMKIYTRKKGVGENSSEEIKFASKFQKVAAKIEQGVKFQVVSNSFDSSGHHWFWENDIPAITLTHDWENDPNSENNHTSNDFIETLNLKTFRNSFEFLSSGVIAWTLDIE